MSVKSIVILTGAGISAESGIATFRAADGLWENHRIEDVATPEGFAKNPALVHRFYNMRRAALKTVKPNLAHLALAQLEQAIERRGGHVLLVTQNVDNLHSRAGCRSLIHMHGALTQIKCTSCEQSHEWYEGLSGGTPCPTCGITGDLRPDIVWFGEIPYAMDDIEAALSTCDLFVSIGTSGAVYPAAGFVRAAKAYGAKTLELNLEPSAGSDWFDETLHGPATKIVPAWVKTLL